jgi:hypothetical protein
MYISHLCLFIFSLALNAALTRMHDKALTQAKINVENERKVNDEASVVIEKASTVSK